MVRFRWFMMAASLLCVACTIVLAMIGKTTDCIICGFLAIALAYVATE